MSKNFTHDLRKNGKRSHYLPSQKCELGRPRTRAEIHRYREKVAKSKAKQKDIDQIASDINKKWWEENKHRFLQQ